MVVLDLIVSDYVSTNLVRILFSHTRNCYSLPLIVV